MLALVRYGQLFKFLVFNKNINCSASCQLRSYCCIDCCVIALSCLNLSLSPFMVEHGRFLLVYFNLIYFYRVRSSNSLLNNFYICTVWLLLELIPRCYQQNILTNHRCYILSLRVRLPSYLSKHHLTFIRNLL